jgi:hypothetical protein
MVAVFLGGKFATVGRIVRRPVPSRHLLIECRDVNGEKCISRMWGLKDKEVQIWRVMVVHSTCHLRRKPSNGTQIRTVQSKWAPMGDPLGDPLSLEKRK